MILLLTIVSCSKDKTSGVNINQCGTIADNSWTSSVSSSDLLGAWTVKNVSYSKGIESTHIYDTSYYSEMPLILNADGTGTINSTPLLWQLSNAGGLPRLTISEMDTLYPFPVGFFINNVTDLSIQAPPHSKILFSAGKSTNGQWEQSYISIEKQ